MSFQSIDFSGPAVVTVEQFARAFQVSSATVRRWHARGKLPVQPLRVGRRILFPLGPVLALFDSEAQPKN